MESSIENLMEDEIMDLLLKADGVNRRDLWQVIGQARLALSGGDTAVVPGVGADPHLAASAGMAPVRHDGKISRE